MKTVLLVDDEKVILASVGNHLTNEGYQVFTAGSGNEAVQTINEHHIDVIVTDLSMENGDGLFVLKEAKKRIADIRVIIVTGYGNLDSAINALRLGVDDFMTKPANIDELLWRVSQCIIKQEIDKKIKLYEKVVTICAYCHSKIKDHQIQNLDTEPKWHSIDTYIRKKTGLDISHGMCPECFEKENNKIS
ncbi:MAG: response regulator [Proteobacteria bacterium]|nr:response regulator [Pseudomonadota bacterium]